MAIIHCNDCGRFYFDKKNNCPKCGCPTAVSLGVRAKKRTKHYIAIDSLDRKIDTIKNFFGRRKY